LYKKVEASFEKVFYCSDGQGRLPSFEEVPYYTFLVVQGRLPSFEEVFHCSDGSGAPTLPDTW
jgi:hypothetical protein